MSGEHAEGWPELCGVGRSPGKQKAHSFLSQQAISSQENPRVIGEDTLGLTDRDKLGPLLPKTL